MPKLLQHGSKFANVIHATIQNKQLLKRGYSATEKYKESSSRFKRASFRLMNEVYTHTNKCVWRTRPSAHLNIYNTVDLIAKFKQQ